jgi:3-oxoadipate enol-lactonase
MPKLEVNGETINYLKVGRGPVIAFIHFLGHFSYQWREQIDLLKDRYTCIAYDQRGFGFSTHNRPWTAESSATDLKGVLDALGVDKAHIVSYSMGGPVALAFNSKWPQIARSITLIDTFAKNHTHTEARISEAEKCFRYMSMREYARQYSATRLLLSTPQSAVDELVSAICLASKEGYMAVLRGVLIPDFSPLCKDVKVPTLVICGEHDKITPVAFTSDLTRLIDGAIERIIPGGHLGAIDEPETISRPLIEFLDAQPR